MAAVITNRDRGLFAARSAVLQYDLGKSLRRMPHNISVHPEKPEPHDAAQTCRPELQPAEKAALDLFDVAGDGAQFVLSLPSAPG